MQLFIYFFSHIYENFKHILHTMSIIRHHIHFFSYFTKAECDSILYKALNVHNSDKPDFHAELDFFSIKNHAVYSGIF